MIFQPQIIGKPLPTLTNPGTAADLLSGKQLIDANGNVLTGTMPTQGAQTIRPGATAKTIAAGRYLTGVQTIQGDADLVPGNIKSGINIFGVDGALSGESFISTDPSYNAYGGDIQTNLVNTKYGDYGTITATVSNRVQPYKNILAIFPDKDIVIQYPIDTTNLLAVTGMLCIQTQSTYRPYVVFVFGNYNNDRYSGFSYRSTVTVNDYTWEISIPTPSGYEYLFPSNFSSFKCTAIDIF